MTIRSLASLASLAAPASLAAASIALSGCHPSYEASPFEGKWVEVTGIQDVVPWTNVAEIPRQSGESRPSLLHGIFTRDGWLNCREFSLENKFGSPWCRYYRRSFDPATGPKLELVGEIEDQVVGVRDLDGDGAEDWVTSYGGVLWGGWNGKKTPIPLTPNGIVDFFEPDGDGRVWVVARAQCSDLRVLTVVRQKTPGGREFEDVSSLLPTTPPVNTQEPTAHCLPSGDCYLIALGTDCTDPLKPIDPILRRAAGETAWKVFAPPDLNTFSLAPMGAIWQDLPDGDSIAWITENPEHTAYRASKGQPWQPLKIGWAYVPSPATGRSQIAWNFRIAMLDGRHAICTGHGFDNPYDAHVQEIGSETINCFARAEGGGWVELTDPVLNRTGGEPGVAADKQLWGQFRDLDVSRDADGRVWLSADVIAGFGDRHPRLLVYTQTP